jgi:hypothetical protein
MAALHATMSVLSFLTIINATSTIICSGRRLSAWALQQSSHWKTANLRVSYARSRPKRYYLHFTPRLTGSRDVQCYTIQNCLSVETPDCRIAPSCIIYSMDQASFFSRGVQKCKPVRLLHCSIRKLLYGNISPYTPVNHSLNLKYPSHPTEGYRAVCRQSLCSNIQFMR